MCTYFFATVDMTLSRKASSERSSFSVAVISTAMPSSMLRKRSFVDACCILALTGAVSGALYIVLIASKPFNHAAFLGGKIYHMLTGTESTQHDPTAHLSSR